MLKQQIKTSDLYFAAFLQSVGCKIINSEQEGSKNVFTFEDEQGRTDLKDHYFNSSKESAIPALVFANNIRSLKTLVYVH